MGRRKVDQRELPAPTGESEIWKIAALLVDRLKIRAPVYAARRGENARRNGDDATRRIWMRINAAIEELLKAAPSENDTVH